MPLGRTALSFSCVLQVGGGISRSFRKEEILLLSIFWGAILCVEKQSIGAWNSIGLSQFCCLPDCMRLGVILESWRPFFRLFLPLAIPQCLLKKAYNRVVCNAELTAVVLEPSPRSPRMRWMSIHFYIHQMRLAMFRLPSPVAHFFKVLHHPTRSIPPLSWCTRSSNESQCNNLNIKRCWKLSSDTISLKNPLFLTQNCVKKRKSFFTKSLFFT